MAQPPPRVDSYRTLAVAQRRARDADGDVQTLARARRLTQATDDGLKRRTAKSIGHRFARLIQQAVLTPPANGRAIIHGYPSLRVAERQK